MTDRARQNAFATRSRDKNLKVSVNADKVTGNQTASHSYRAKDGDRDAVSKPSVSKPTTHVYRVSGSKSSDSRDMSSTHSVTSHHQMTSQSSRSGDSTNRWDRQSDHDSRMKRDTEKSNSVSKEPGDQYLSEFEQDQLELQKRIDELKREIVQEKSKIKEMTSRGVCNTNASESVVMSPKSDRMNALQMLGKTAKPEPRGNTTSDHQKSHGRPVLDRKDDKDQRKDSNRSHRSRSPVSRRERSPVSRRDRSPISRRGRSPISQGERERKKTGSPSPSDNRANRSANCDSKSRSHRSISRDGRSNDRRNRDQRSNDRRSRDRKSNDRRSHKTPRDRDRSRSRSAEKRDDKTRLKRDERRSSLSRGKEFLEKIQESRKLFDRDGSPSSVCSFDLNWPRSPRQPGFNLKMRDDCISPMSQLHALKEAKLYRQEAVPMKRVHNSEAGSHLLRQQHLARRVAQRKNNTEVWTGRTADCFELIQPIGRGSFGQVFKAADKDKNLLVAVKKLLVDSKSGFRVHALQEILNVSLLKHPNIARLLEVCLGSNNKEPPETLGSYFLVYEYVAHDLEGLIAMMDGKLSLDNVATIMVQLLDALEYCHGRDLAHCDIKPSCILITYRGEVRLTQFGKAQIVKQSADEQRLTQASAGSVLWYKSPEILLGSEVFRAGVDMWGCGCVLGEMIRCVPLFPGRDDMHQLQLISEVCGSPNPISWPEVMRLPLYYMVKNRQQHTRRLRDEFYFLPRAAIDLLDLLLMLDPLKRCTAAEALKMEWLCGIDIHNMPPINLPKSLDCHASSKSEQSNREVVLTKGVKRSHSTEDYASLRKSEAQTDLRIKKELNDKAIASVLREAIETLQQKTQGSLERNTSVLKAELDPPQYSSATPSSALEKPAPFKHANLNFRVMDYQHKTTINEQSSETTERSIPKGTEDISMARDMALGKYLSSQHKPEEFARKPENVQVPMSHSGVRHSTSSQFEVADGYRALPQRLNYPDVDSRNLRSDEGQCASLPAEKAINTSELSSQSSAPVLSDSSIAFWSAMKAYCAKLGPAKSNAPSADSGKSLESSLNLNSGTGSTFHDTDYRQIGLGQNMSNVSERRDLSYLHQASFEGSSRNSETWRMSSRSDADSKPMSTLFPYGDLYGGGQRPHLHRKTADVAEYGMYGGPKASTQPYPAASGTDLYAGSIATSDSQLAIPKEQNAGAESLTSASRPVSSTRIHHVMPRNSEKGLDCKAAGPASSSTQPGPSFDSEKTQCAPTTGPCFPCFSTTNPRPKLAGILKNRLDVKPESQELNSSEPKQ